MVELASARSNIVSPVALILGPIRPYLDAKTMSNVSANFQLTLIDSAIRVYDLFSELKAFFL